MRKVEMEVEFGIESFDPERKVEIPLRDALFAYKAIGEFIAFFHQPANWSSLEQVQEFIGNRTEGGLHVLCESYYQRLRDVWPADVQEAFDDGLLDRTRSWAGMLDNARSLAGRARCRRCEASKTSWKRSERGRGCS